MRNILRKATPTFLLKWYRRRKKNKTNKALNASRDRGEAITKETLKADFQKAGINIGDTLLVHSSLSKIGFVEGGAQTVVEALLESVGTNGNLLMPTSPNPKLQLDYIRDLEIFDVANTPSALGAITEYFRRLPNVRRSEHPTEPVSCIGPNTDYLVGHHFGSMTPYTDKSPFFRVAEVNGKILYLGVTLDNAGTSLHTLEDAVEDFKYPVYYSEVFEVKLRFPNGDVKAMKTKVHNPEQSAKRKCDGLIPLFIREGLMERVKIGKADALIVDAKGMFQCMVKAYNESGVTMYTPNGA